MEGLIDQALGDRTRQQPTTEQERQWQKAYMTTQVSLMHPLPGHTPASTSSVKDPKHAIGGKPLLMRLPREGMESVMEVTNDVPVHDVAKTDWVEWEKQHQAKEKAAKAVAAKPKGTGPAPGEEMAALAQANAAKVRDSSSRLRTTPLYLHALPHDMPLVTPWYGVGVFLTLVDPRWLSLGRRVDPVA